MILLTPLVALGASISPDQQEKIKQESLSQAFASVTNSEIVTSRKIIQIVNEETNKYNLNYFRVLALIVAESRGNPLAKSKVGALGLMQIMPETGKIIARGRNEPWRGINSLYDIQVNIAYGTWYYNYLLQVFQGDTVATIAAYNWGPEHIKSRLRKGQKLPQVYPKKVLEAEIKLQKEFTNEITIRYWRNLNKYNPLPYKKEQTLRH